MPLWELPIAFTETSFVHARERGFSQFVEIVKRLGFGELSFVKFKGPFESPQNQSPSGWEIFDLQRQSPQAAYLVRFHQGSPNRI